MKVKCGVFQGQIGKIVPESLGHFSSFSPIFLLKCSLLTSIKNKFLKLAMIGLSFHNVTLIIVILGSI